MTTIMQLECLTNNLQGAREGCLISMIFILIPRRVNITFNVNDVKEIDEERHKVTFDIELVASWQDTRISCRSCGATAAEEDEEVTNPYVEQKSFLLNFRHLHVTFIGVQYGKYCRRSADCQQWT